MSDDHPRVIALPPAIYAGAFVLGLILERFWPSYVIGRLLGYAVGAFLLLMGFIMMFLAVREFRAAGTNIEVYRPATALVTTGLYGFSRNPIYIGMTMAYAGAATIANSLWTLALVIPVLVLIDRGVVRREEPYLAEKFGDAYREYVKRVPRWV